MDKKRPELTTVLSCLRDSESVNLEIDRGDCRRLHLFGEAAFLKDVPSLNGYFVDSIGCAPLQGIEIEVSKDISSNDDPDKKVDDDRIRFGDVVVFKTYVDDITTGIVISIQDDGIADILYKKFYDDRLDVAHMLLKDLRRLKITYSEITEDVMEWLAN